MINLTYHAGTVIILIVQVCLMYFYGRMNYKDGYSDGMLETIQIEIVESSETKDNK